MVDIEEVQRAVRDGDLDFLDEIRKKEFDISWRDDSGSSLLHVSVSFGRMAFVTALLQNGANINLSDRDGDTPLHVAVGRHEYEIMTALLNFSRVDVNAKNRFNVTPLHIAAEEGCSVFVATLLERGADVSVRNMLQYTPMCLAAKMGHKDVVEIILRHLERKSCGCEASYSDNGSTEERFKLDENRNFKKFRYLVSNSLLLSAQSKKAEVVQLLLSRGADSDFVDMFGATAVHAAVQRNLTYDLNYSYSPVDACATAKILLSSGRYNVNALNFDASTPLHLAIASCDCTKKENKNERRLYRDATDKLLKLLLENKAGTGLRNSKGTTPLINAAENGCTHIVRILLSSGFSIDIDAKDVSGQTALIKAAEGLNSGSLEIIRLLIRNGASVQARDYRGFTALHAASIATVELIANQVNHDPRDTRTEVVWTKRIAELDDSIQSDERLWMEWLEKQIEQEDDDDYFDKSVEDDFSLTGSKDQIQVYRREEAEAVNAVHARKDFIEEDAMWKQVFGEFEKAVKKFKNMWKEVDVVKELVAVGCADLNALDFGNNTPLEVALKRFRQTDRLAIEQLRRHGSSRSVLKQDDVLESNTTSHQLLMETKNNLTSVHLLIALYDQWENRMYSYDLQKDSLPTVKRTMPVSNKGYCQPKVLLSLKQLVAHCADDMGRTALHYAAMLPISEREFPGYENQLKSLIQSGCDVNEGDCYGRTPLHYAEREYMYEALLRHGGANRYIRDLNGKSVDELRGLKAEEKELVKRNRTYCETIFPRKLNMRVSEVLSLAEQSPKGTNLLQLLYPEVDISATAWKIWTHAEFAYRNPVTEGLCREMKDFMDRLLVAVTTREPRFAGRQMLVGSANEGSKIDFPTEYDFDIVLTEVSEICEVLDSPIAPKGFVHLKRKAHAPTQSVIYSRTEFLRTGFDFDSFFNENDVLLVDEVLLRFHYILAQVVADPVFWKTEPIFELAFDQKLGIISPDFSSKLCKTLRLILKRPIAGKHFFQAISVDVVPCFHIEDWWPDGVIQSVASDEHLPDKCVLVVDQPQRNYPWVPFSDPFVRISFAPWESHTVATCRPAARAAYLVGKQILRKDPTQTFALKTSLLYCIEALSGRTCGDRSHAADEEVTSGELSLWVRTLFKCYLLFFLQDFVPCYFMPAFSMPFEGQMKSNHMRDHSLGYGDKSILLDLPYFDEDSTYLNAWCYYWSVCASEQVEVEFQLPVPQPLTEEFDRAELIRELSRCHRN